MESKVKKPDVTHKRHSQHGKNSAWASQSHLLDYVLISLSIHILLGIFLASSLMRHFDEMFGVRSLTVSPFEIEQNNQGDYLIVDFLPASYVAVDPVNNWRETYIHRPLLDSPFYSQKHNPAKTSRQLDPEKAFVPCREFRCVASNKRHSMGRFHWLHVSNPNRIEATLKGAPLAVVLPIVVTEASEPMNIYLTSDADIEVIVAGAPGVRISRVIMESRYPDALHISSLVAYPDKTGLPTRYFLTNNIKSGLPRDHLIPHAPNINNDRLIPNEPPGIPPAPLGGPDQIVEVGQLAASRQCKDRIVYIGSDHSYSFDVQSKEGSGSMQLVARFPANHAVRSAIKDPCSRGG